MSPSFLAREGSGVRVLGRHPRPLFRKGRGEEDTKDALDLGFYLSFSGIVTFQNATMLRDIAKTVPLDRLLIETDCPYLTPVPHRGKRNEPAYVTHVAQQLAALRAGEPEMSVETIGRITTRNAKQLFSRLR